MIIAVKNDHKDIVELLLNAGADNMNEALVAAVKNDHNDIVRLP